MSNRNPRDDPAVRLAAQTLTQHFTDKSNQPIRTPLYITQLQVLYERDFFPWVIADAIRILTEDKALTQFRKIDLPNPDQIPNVRDIVFVANSQAYTEKPDLVKIHAQSTAELVNRYSNPEITKAVGNQLEGLVKYELRAKQFNITGLHTNQFKDKTWTQTGHNLDIVAQHNSGNLNIGVEVKNTLDLMEPEEIDKKIDMCHFLGLIPVFAIRWMKPYIDCIRNQGGYSWVFKTQIYPPGFEALTKLLYDKLSFTTRSDSQGTPLQFPVTVRTDIPEKPATALTKWVAASLQNPPQRNPTARCRGSRETDDEDITNADVYVQ